MQTDLCVDDASPTFFLHTGKKFTFYNLNDKIGYMHSCKRKVFVCWLCSQSQSLILIQTFLKLCDFFPILLPMSMITDMLEVLNILRVCRKKRFSNKNDIGRRNIECTFGSVLHTCNIAFSLLPIINVDRFIDKNFIISFASSSNFSFLPQIVPYQHNGALIHLEFMGNNILFMNDIA